MSAVSWRGSGWVLLTLALFTASGRAVQADPIAINYSTSTGIIGTGIDGNLEAVYQYVSGGTVATTATAPIGTVLDPAPSGVGSPLPLGTFTFDPPGDPATTTYTNTPFNMVVVLNSVNGNTDLPYPKAFVFGGFLNGSISATGPSWFSVTFTTTPPLNATYPAGSIGYFGSPGYGTFLAVPTGTLTITSPDGVPQGGLSITGTIITEYPAPEPTSLVVLSFLGLAHVGALRLRSRRRRDPLA